MDQIYLFLNLLKYSQKFPNLYFVRYLSYGLLKIHRKLTSGYLLCDKASSRLKVDPGYHFEVTDHVPLTISNHSFHQLTIVSYEIFTD